MFCVYMELSLIDNFVSESETLWKIQSMQGVVETNQRQKLAIFYQKREWEKTSSDKMETKTIAKKKKLGKILH